MALSFAVHFPQVVPVWLYTVVPDGIVQVQNYYKHDSVVLRQWRYQGHDAHSMPSN